MADWNPGDVVAVRAEYRDRLVRSDASQTHAMVRIDDTHDLATATWAVPLDALTTYLPAAAVADLVALVARCGTTRRHAVNTLRSSALSINPSPQRTGSAE